MNKVMTAIHIFLSVLLMPLFLLAVQTGTARAAVEVGVDVERELASCSAIISRTSRLICYDDLAGKLGHLPQSRADREASVLEKYGFWEVAKRRSAAGEDIIYLKNDSVEQVVSKLGLQRNPTLVIKCKSGQTDVYLDWKTKLVPQNLGGLNTLPITIQLDSEDRETVYWEISTDRNAIFAPNPVEFVKKMRQSDKLVLYVTPTYDIVQTVVHDISGLNAVLEVLVAHCYN